MYVQLTLFVFLANVIMGVFKYQHPFRNMLRSEMQVTAYIV